MPVVKGEERTKWEMLIYTLLLLPLTIMPACVRCPGGHSHAVAAVLPSARLLWYCIVLLREVGAIADHVEDVPLFLLYLFLLFLAMGIDRYPVSRGARGPPEVVILRAGRRSGSPGPRSPACSASCTRASRAAGCWPPRPCCCRSPR